MLNSEPLGGWCDRIRAITRTACRAAGERAIDMGQQDLHDSRTEGGANHPRGDHATRRRTGARRREPTAGDRTGRVDCRQSARPSFNKRTTRDTKGDTDLKDYYYLT